MMRKNSAFLLLIYISLVRSLPLLDNFDIWGDQSANLSDNARNSRVLNFFPVPFEEECSSVDKRRKGVCMNTYECRIQGGTSHGPCALGFGVCCIFTATCADVISNNITYFVNPDFPDLSSSRMTSCAVSVKKIDPEIAQFRLDFIHFNLGQPNRQTGVCENEVFQMSAGGTKELNLCGLNSGQHAYFDIEDVNDPVTIRMNLSNKVLTRLWEIRLVQVPFNQRAPAGCLQYHTAPTGVIQTMNFAENGRHLANQDYNICMRQEEGMCTIAYEPCHENSFKIGPATTTATNQQQQSPTLTDQTASESEAEPAIETSSVAQEDVEEGSGDGATVGGREGDAGACADRIVMPCDSEDLLMPDGIGYCDLAHCGNSLCPLGESPCRIESSVTPFMIGVQFGPAAREESPEDNLGMCLKYEQLPCLK